LSRAIFSAFCCDLEYRALAALKHEVEMSTVNAHRAVAVRKILSLNRNAPGAKRV
jgi:hypothetical protein